MRFAPLDEINNLPGTRLYSKKLFLLLSGLHRDERVLLVYVQDNIYQLAVGSSNTKDLYRTVVPFGNFTLVGIHRALQQNFCIFVEYLENILARYESNTVRADIKKNY